MKSGWYQIIDRFISDADEIHLSYKDNMFTLEFSTFDFGSHESVHYQYMMEGLNDQWVNTEKGVNRISFTNLSYGNYKLHIKASINVSALYTLKDFPSGEIILFPFIK